MSCYIMSPDLSGNRISFLRDNDLWFLENEGGNPRRMTSDMGVVTDSKFSPDGKYIAFRLETGKDGSSADLFTIRLQDGRMAQITFLSGRSTSRRMYTNIAGWTPEGWLVVSSDMYSPFGAMTQLYSASPDGGPLEPMNYGPASDILFAGEDIILGRNTVDMPHWKGYKGGTSGVLWKGRKGGGFSKIVDLGHHISCPIILGGRIYFITDMDGTGNLYSTDINGKDLRKETEFTDFHVRKAKTDGKAVVFQKEGRIFRFIPGKGSSEISIGNLPPSIHNRKRFADPAANIEYFSSSHDGGQLSIVTRGRLFSSSVKGGPVAETGSSGEHIRLPMHIGNGSVAYISDRGGEEDLYTRSLKTGETARLKVSRGTIEYAAASPNGDKVLLSNNRGELFSVDISKAAGAGIKEIDSTDAGIISDISWSPDGNYALYAMPEMAQSLGRMPSTVVKLHSFTDGKSYTLSESGSRDFSPFFSLGGDTIHFLSTRHLDAVPDNLVFDFSFPVTMVLNAIPMNREASLELDHISGDYADADGERFSLDTLIERQRTLGLKPSEYKVAAPVEGGILLLEYAVEGLSKYYLFSREKRPGNLVRYDSETGKSSVVAEKITDFRASKDGKRVAVMDSSGSISTFSLSSPGRENWSAFPVASFKLLIDPLKEWEEMLGEEKRLVRENYWNESMIENDFSGVFNKYDHLLESLSSRFEFSDVLREFQGEFRTSHSYEMGGDITSAEACPAGRLGLDIEHRDGKYAIKHVVKADFSYPNEKSPVYYGHDVLREGDIILSINNTPLGPDTTPEELLYNRAGDTVRIEAERNGSRFHVFVKTLADDRHMRYREWVERNREYVHNKSGGRVGYIHIPDMGFNGFAEFTRLYPIESRKDALIVDVRYNGGGSVSQILLEKLAKQRVAYGKPRRGETQAYPVYSVNGPMVALTNESAGSDGDIFTHSFKLMNLGPVIGTRTWGGVVGINPRHGLVDGTMVTQPQFAFWFKDVQYGVENYGSDPTIEVHNTPDDWINGYDAQLEKGIEEVTGLLRKNGTSVDPPE